jgi:hypothetical protein
MRAESTGQTRMSGPVESFVVGGRDYRGPLMHTMGAELKDRPYGPGRPCLRAPVSASIAAGFRLPFPGRAYAGSGVRSNRNAIAGMKTESITPGTAMPESFNA